MESGFCEGLGLNIRASFTAPAWVVLFPIRLKRDFPDVQGAEMVGI
mgnify:CR=1 FL=1